MKKNKYTIWSKWGWYIALSGPVLIIIANFGRRSIWLAIAGIILMFTAIIAKFCLWRCPYCNERILGRIKTVKIRINVLIAAKKSI